MKRLGALFAAVLVAFVISGCGESGIQEGTPPDAGKESAIPPGFKEQMERDAAKMQMKGKPADAQKAIEAGKAGAAEAEKKATP
jgi:hypothetical protein